MFNEFLVLIFTFIQVKSTSKNWILQIEKKPATAEKKVFRIVFISISLFLVLIFNITDLATLGQRLKDYKEQNKGLIEIVKELKSEKAENEKKILKLEV